MYDLTLPTSSHLTFPNSPCAFLSLLASLSPQGYGLSVAALAGYALQASQGKLSRAAAAQIGLLGLFGIRLAAFLHFRTKAESYAARPEMADVKRRMHSVSLLKRVLMWLPVSAMYVGEEDSLPACLSACLPVCLPACLPVRLSAPLARAL